MFDDTLKEDHSEHTERVVAAHEYCPKWHQVENEVLDGSHDQRYLLDVHHRAHTVGNDCKHLEVKYNHI